MGKETNCAFCDIIEGREHAATVWQDKEYICFMDRYPMNPGHSLVTPKKHYTFLNKMPIAEVGELFERVARISNATYRVLKPDGMNIGQSNGEVASQSVFHVHVHIVPRFNGDAKEGFWPKRKKYTFEQLDELAKKIGKKVESSE